MSTAQTTPAPADAEDMVRVQRTNTLVDLIRTERLNAVNAHLSNQPGLSQQEVQAQVDLVAAAVVEMALGFMEGLSGEALRYGQLAGVQPRDRSSAEYKFGYTLGLGASVFIPLYRIAYADRLGPVILDVFRQLVRLWKGDVYLPPRYFTP
jgi:hypothetical protein